MVLVCSISFIVLPSTQVSAKSLKPGKTSITSVNRVSKTVVKINWKKVSKASGYQLYMKTNSGSFKKIKTTASRSYKKTGLKIGNTYCFKVRAYTKYNKKTYFGAFSMVKKINIKNYVYLTDVMKSYRQDCREFYEYTNDYFKMAGNKYYHGFILRTWYAGSTAYALYNLNGKYKKISFDLGPVQDYSDDNGEITVNGDDEILKTISRKENELPKNYTINVSDVYKLEFKISPEYYFCLGFGNIKLYY